jgi:hypothetical protein
MLDAWNVVSLRLAVTVPTKQAESETAEGILGFVASLNIRLLSDSLVTNACLSDFVLAALCLTGLTLLLHMRLIDILQES